jgi:hypothetical protein
VTETGATNDPPFAIVDISDWAGSGPEPTGSKPNLWVTGPDGTQWLFKERTYNPAPGGGLHPKGDDWVEKLATEIAAMLGVPTAQVELARRKGRLGIISRRVDGADEQLSLGNEVLARFANEYPAAHGRGIEGYTVANVAAALRSLPALSPPGSTVTDCVSVFAGYLVLDAVIGNTDRHDRNWAVIRGRDNSIRLSPSFDHASSLGFALSDNERNRRLQSTDRQFVPAAFAKRVKDTVCRTAASVHDRHRRPPGCGAGRHHQLARCGLRTAGRWIEVENASARHPEPVSEPARRFALAVLSVNVQQFLSQVEGTLAS